MSARVERSMRRARTVRLLAVGVASLVALLGAPRASAKERPPRSITDGYSSYERGAIALAEVELHGSVDPHPEGKLIESVEVVRLDPIDPRDPALQSLNLLHATTLESLVRHELVLAPGQPYRKVLADESARHLRRLPELSLVLCVAFRGSTPGRVRFVAVTKDTWSLIPDVSLPVDSRSASQSLVLGVAERNLLGTQQTLGAHLELAPATNVYGLSYGVPRLAGSFLGVKAAVSVIQNRATGQNEGSRGGLQVILPFRTNRSPWSAFASAIWDVRHVRTPTEEWRSKSISVSSALTRSFGWKLKNDFSLTFLGGSLANEHGGGIPAGGMPPSNSRIGSGLEWHGYTSNFLRTHDFETLGLQEDFRLGHDLVVLAMPLLQIAPWSAQADFPAGADPNRPTRHELLLIYAGVQETLPLGDGLVRASLAGQREYGSDEVRNTFITAHVDLTTPRTGFGRLVSDARAWYRRENWSNQYQWLGGSTGLRGYPDGFIRAPSTFLSHLEYRTPGLSIATEQVGAVLFTDTAAVLGEPAPTQVFSSVGFGVRLVTPAIERAGLRIDVGFPLGQHPNLAPFAVEVAFGQAFDIGALLTFGPPRL